VGEMQSTGLSGNTSKCNVSSIGLCQSARGLAHSKTIREFQGASAPNAPVFGVRQPSTAFPLSCLFAFLVSENSFCVVYKIPAAIRLDLAAHAHDALFIGVAYRVIRKASI
jgi:hypothetical protein